VGEFNGTKVGSRRQITRLDELNEHRNMLVNTFLKPPAFFPRVLAGLALAHTDLERVAKTR
jgi:hypothetical protein